MALPMDEQRILDEMERMLAADDPRLAARLSSFGHPPFAHVLRTARARITFSVMLLALVAAVAAVIYMVSAFRLSGPSPGTRLTHVVSRPVSSVSGGAYASAPPRPLRGPEVAARS